MSPSPAGVYAASIILCVAATTAVALRLYVRYLKRLRLGLDDYTVVAALPFLWALFIILIIGTARGTIGTHTAQDPRTGRVIPTWHERDIAKLAYISQILSICNYGAIKLSVLFFFRRVFVGKTFKLISLVSMYVVGVWTVAFLFATIFQCGNDPRWFWGTPLTLAQHCGRYKQIMLGHAVSDAALDLFILTIPLPIVWKLHMTSRQKAGLLVVFILGYMSAAAAIIRVAFLVDDLYVTTTGARDVRGRQTNYQTWGYVEAGVGIVAACLPVLRPLVHSRLPESLVNSARSKLSLQSNRSKEDASSRSTSVGRTYAYTRADEDANVVELVEQGKAGKFGSRSDSHSHSHPQLPSDTNPDGKSHYTTVEHVPSLKNGAGNEPTEPGIQVVREFTVREMPRESV